MPGVVLLSKTELWIVVEIPAQINLTIHNRAKTIALGAILDCGVSLSNAAHASQSPQSNTRPLSRRSQARLTESVGSTHTSIC